MVRSSGSGAQAPSFAQLKITVFAFAFGVVVLAAVGAFLGPVGGALEEGGDDTLGTTLLYALGASAVALLPLAVVFRRWGYSRVEHRREDALAEIDDGKVPPEIAQSIILSAAMVEAVGLFGGVVVLISGNSIALAACVVSVVGIVLSAPSEAALRAGVGSSGRVH